MQLAFICGIIIIGSLLVGISIALAERAGSAVIPFINILTFIANLPDSAAVSRPVAFASYETLQATLVNSIFSWGGLFVGLMLALTLFAAVLAFAYTKGLVLTVLRDKRDGVRTKFLDMFRGARTYWKPSIWYYSLFAAFAFVFIIMYLVTIVLMVGKYIIENQEAQTIPAIAASVLVVGVLAMLARLLTANADAVIVNGSRSPIRDSIRFAKKAWLRTLAVDIGLLIVAAAALYALKGIGAVANIGHPVLASLLLFILIAFWRYWVSAFVVFQAATKTPAQRTPRGA